VNSWAKGFRRLLWNLGAEGQRLRGRPFRVRWTSATAMSTRRCVRQRGFGRQGGAPVRGAALGNVLRPRFGTIPFVTTRLSRRCRQPEPVQSDYVDLFSCIGQTPRFRSRNDGRFDGKVRGRAGLGTLASANFTRAQSQLRIHRGANRVSTRSSFYRIWIRAS